MLNYNYNSFCLSAFCKPNFRSMQCKNAQFFEIVIHLMYSPHIQGSMQRQTPPLLHCPIPLTNTCPRDPVRVVSTCQMVHQFIKFSNTETPRTLLSAHYSCDYLSFAGNPAILLKISETPTCVVQFLDPTIPLPTLLGPTHLCESQ